MQEIMIAIVLGIAVGCSDLLNYNVKKWLSRFSTVSLFIMLLCLGAKIGDAELLGKLDQLGGKSLVMAVFIIGGSVLMLWLVLKLFAKTAARAEGSDE
jgi:uncharacterized membrane protein YbjE (DUF340 family)